MDSVTVASSETVTRLMDHVVDWDPVAPSQLSVKVAVFDAAIDQLSIDRLGLSSDTVTDALAVCQRDKV